MGGPIGNQHAKGCKTNGRPKKEVDLKIIHNLAKIQCTNQEIASVIECSPTTITNRKDILEAVERGREKGKESLRRALWEAATQKYNPTILIWLSKQYLGMREPDNEIKEFAKNAFEKYLEAQKARKKERMENVNKKV